MYACPYTYPYTQTCMKIHIHTYVHTYINTHICIYIYIHTLTNPLAPSPTYTHSAKPATRLNKSNATTAAEPYPGGGGGRLTRASTSPTQHTESGTNIWALLKNVPVSSEVLFIPL
jgi:hypothetical protein